MDSGSRTCRLGEKNPRQGRRACVVLVSMAKFSDFRFLSRSKWNAREIGGACLFVSKWGIHFLQYNGESFHLVEDEVKNVRGLGEACQD